VVQGQKNCKAPFSAFEVLYEALNGLMDTKVNWELNKDRKISLQGFQRPYEALHCFMRH
jgi:hypothetical protein